MKTVSRCKNASIAWIAKQLARGVWVRITTAFQRRTSESAKVRTFFQMARRVETAHHVVDLSDPSYAILCQGFEHAAQLTQSSNLRVIDLGCGSCAFHKYLQERGFVITSYVGVDLYFGPHDVDYGSDYGITLIESDLCDGRWMPAVTGNLLVAINCFCYVESLAQLIKQLRDVQLEHGSRFLIVDPLPSLMWEPHFEGISLWLRKPKIIDRILAQEGWEVQGRHVLYAAKLFGRHLLPMSHLSVYIKRGATNSSKDASN